MEKIKSLLLSQPIKFLNGGVAMKAVSFALNYVLADLMQLNVQATYVFVLVCDFLLGFVINRYLVFNQTKDDKNSKVFTKFIVAGLGFRALNWCIYVAIVEYIKIYILWAQLIATLIVLVLKYSIYKKIFK